MLCEKCKSPMSEWRLKKTGEKICALCASPRAPYQIPETLGTTQAERRLETYSITVPASRKLPTMDQQERRMK